MKRVNTASTTPASSFKNNVLKANRDLTYVVSTHLFIESLLINWLSQVLPKPDKLFNDYRPTFQQIIALCQAHNLLSDDIASVLKKLNTLRNKFSHNLLYRPDDQIIDDFLSSLRKMKKPFYVAVVEPTERELGLALAALCGFIQEQAENYSNNKKI